MTDYRDHHSLSHGVPPIDQQAIGQTEKYDLVTVEGMLKMIPGSIKKTLFKQRRSFTVRKFIKFRSNLDGQ